jgi:hypothetical protein
MSLYVGKGGPELEISRADLRSLGDSVNCSHYLGAGYGTERIRMKCEASKRRDRSFFGVIA